MRRVLLRCLLALLLRGSASAEDGNAARKAQIEGARLYYEEMLRDAKTETAAKYFVARLGDIAVQRAALAKRAARLPQPPAARSGVLTSMNVWLQKRIMKQVTQKDVTLSDVVAWTRRELPEAFWEELGKGVGARAIPPRAYAESTWAGRSKSGWFHASYGSGTYIVTPSKPTPPRKDRHDRLPEAVKKKLKLDPPKPPTRDEWWAHGSRALRTDWTLAYFVENSGIFEVADEPRFTKCRSCTGEGYQGRKLESGLSVSYLCHRCGGVGADKTVRYR